MRNATFGHLFAEQTIALRLKDSETEPKTSLHGRGSSPGETDDLHRSSEVEVISVEAEMVRPDRSAGDYIKRTYQIREDQDTALGVAVALGTSPHGSDRSAIIERLLDLHGYREGGQIR